MSKARVSYLVVMVCTALVLIFSWCGIIWGVRLVLGMIPAQYKLTAMGDGIRAASNAPVASALVGASVIVAALVVCGRWNDHNQYTRLALTTALLLAMLVFATIWIAVLLMVPFTAPAPYVLPAE